MSDKLHILLVASAGGHWIELVRLRKAWKGLRASYLTTDPGLADAVREMSSREGQDLAGFHVVPEANRWQKRRLVALVFRMTYLLVRLRPDIVLTTGAAPGYLALRIGKLLGARTVWIDSIANADELSLSGQKAGRCADLWLTQWEHLARPGGPRYMGTVL